MSGRLSSRSDLVREERHVRLRGRPSGGRVLGSRAGERRGRGLHLRACLRRGARWGGPNMWFRGGRGDKRASNGVHLDLRSLTTMDREVERLVGLGASVVERYDAITVMQDPEGNELCVERGPG